MQAHLEIESSQLFARTLFATAMAPIYLIWLIPAAGLLVILVYGSFTLGRRKARREERQRLEALKAGYRARDLAKQLLVIGRGSSPERGPITLAQLIEESIQILRASFPRTVKNQREIDPDAGFISGHLSQIYQVIINLCLNARDAM